MAGAVEFPRVEKNQTGAAERGSIMMAPKAGLFRHPTESGDSVRRLLMPIWFASLAFTSAPAAHAAVTPELQQAIRASTFEVVMKKPDKDPAIYEKPLPLDLLPFHERNDAYRSIGTAFSLGHNTYVTAAHVFGLGIDSQFGVPQLRNSAGAVFSIDQIVQFSMHEDFVVFSVRGDPAPIGLPVNREPRIDDLVLAVGNALGEGIVIRDGLYTSATDEDQDGQWKWIRFSAAASPGNSGGPLLDGVGRVIGIVIGKSPNENLNYSLPISRVLDAQDHQARFDQRLLIALPYLHGTTTYRLQDAFTLPLTWPAFVAGYQSVLARHGDEAQAGLLNTYRDTLFPKGTGSESVLFDPNPNGYRPYEITQQPDGAWGVTAPDFTSTELPGDGSVSVAEASGATLLRIVRPDAADGDDFFADSKAFMDLALMALNVRRTVGPDQIRVVSLGTALSDVPFLDSYGRRWQERTWAVPFLDMYIVGLLLPTPDGYVAIIEHAPSSALRATKNQAHLVSRQVGTSLSGSLRQWQAYLRRRASLPDSLKDISLERAPDWILRTRQFTSSVPASVLPLTEKSPLNITMGFNDDGKRLTWDIAEVWWNVDDRMDAAVGLSRHARPPKGAKLELRNDFASMNDRRSPYDGQILRETADTFSALQVLDVPGNASGTISADLLYVLTLRVTGHPTVQEVLQSLQKAAAATRLLEHGVGESVPATAKAGSGVDAEYDKMRDEAVAAAAQAEATVGADIRGHRLSQDVHEFYDNQRTRALAVPMGSSSAEALQGQQQQQFQALQDYWRNYPMLTHNRDLWRDFLSRNQMPPGTPHDSSVTRAETALLAALASGIPSPEWSSLAKALRIAYIEERSRLAKSSNITPLRYRARTSPCPPPADVTSKKSTPSFRRTNRSLEDYWPFESKRLGEEGTVKISMHISATGCALDAAIWGSSGSEMLDEAVLQFFETIDFYPAEVDGKATESTAAIPIVFKYKD
jgi:TonB family protein